MYTVSYYSLLADYKTLTNDKYNFFFRFMSLTAWSALYGTKSKGYVHMSHKFTLETHTWHYEINI